MSNRTPTLGMEPTESRALNIMRLAGEQADQIAALERALADMTERCRTAENRAWKVALEVVAKTCGDIAFEWGSVEATVTEAANGPRIARAHKQGAQECDASIRRLIKDA